ncbi:MAG: YeiH family protein [Treponemataceae bacterium]
MNNLWGIGLALAVAGPSWFLGKALPLVGGPVFGILLGILIALQPRPARFEAGLKFTTKKILQAAIILLGFEMNLSSVFAVGGESLLVMAFTLTAAFLTAWGVSRALSLTGKTPVLIGVGTAICGGSAIAATAPVIGADDDEVARSISTIFLFNVLAVFIFPPIGHALGLSDTGFGLWAGTAVNDTSSVVATGLAYSDAALKYATIVKLTRTLLIIPIVMILAVYTARKSAVSGTESHGKPVNIVKIFPWFVIGFLAASVLRTTGLVNESVAHFLATAGKFLIVMAMASIGLNTKLGKLIASGWKPIALGLSCWAAVAVTSLFAQFLSGRW